MGLSKSAQTLPSAGGAFRKPKPNAAAADNFNPYDGLKLAVFPTESGDFKVFARYDYSF